MGYASEEAYEEMISQLSKYQSDVTSSCANMMAAATDCVDNTHNDPSSVAAKNKLHESVDKIAKGIEVIDGIIAALQRELDEIIEARREAQSYD